MLGVARSQFCLIWAFQWFWQDKQNFKRGGIIITFLFLRIFQTRIFCRFPPFWFCKFQYSSIFPFNIYLDCFRSEKMLCKKTLKFLFDFRNRDFFFLFKMNLKFLFILHFQIPWTFWYFVAIFKRFIFLLIFKEEGDRKKQYYFTTLSISPTIQFFRGKIFY